MYENVFTMTYQIFFKYSYILKFLILIYQFFKNSSDLCFYENRLFKGKYATQPLHPLLDPHSMAWLCTRMAPKLGLWSV